MVGNQRQGLAAMIAMGILFIAGVAVTYWAEANGKPAFAALGIDGGNMEGKETRFGAVNSALWGVSTTAASNGSVNSMHDSFTPLGGLVLMFLMQLGEVIFGGVGAGMYGMILMIVLTVFVAGLMVGRTPEYLGKKIKSREIRMVMLALLSAPLVILCFTAAAAVLPAGLIGRNNFGPHGLSEMLYAFSSAFGNNGSAFAGLAGGTYFYNTSLGIAMLVGRFAIIIPALALGGFLAERQSVPESSGTFPVAGPLFIGLLIGVILIIGALTFLPVLALGPLVEHLLMSARSLF